jgi:quinol---cytochrome-c reductase cytochrome c subunit
VRRAARRAAAGLALACAGLALWSAAAGGQASPRAAGDGPPPPRGTAPPLAARGRALYARTCAICHGEDLRGVRGRGPRLIGAGPAAVDFYLATGRMPLADPKDQPLRAEPQFGRRDIAALVDYVGSFGGPPIPRVAPGAGEIARGKEAFTEHCAGCHQVVARGGTVTGALVPSIDGVPPRQLGEAVRIGPYLMPPFDPKAIPAARLDDIAAYVRFTARPDDRGGWGIGNIGPIPEGMVAWLAAAIVLVGVVRLLGERAR